MAYLNKILTYMDQFCFLVKIMKSLSTNYKQGIKLGSGRILQILHGSYNSQQAFQYLLDSSLMTCNRNHTAKQHCGSGVILTGFGSNRSEKNGSKYFVQDLVFTKAKIRLFGRVGSVFFDSVESGYEPFKSGSGFLPLLRGVI